MNLTLQEVQETLFQVRVPAGSFSVSEAAHGGFHITMNIRVQDWVIGGWKEITTDPVLLPNDASTASIVRAVFNLFEQALTEDASRMFTFRGAAIYSPDHGPNALVDFTRSQRELAASDRKENLL